MAAQLTDNELAQRLCVALESWPLYRRLEYKGANNTNTVPQYLSLFCHNCGKDTFWETSLYRGENNRSGFGGKTYTCRNCGKAETRYYFLWAWSEKGEASFMKVGQYPPLEERVPEALEKVFDAEDLAFYKNALRLRNFNLGLGAVAYLRRVVENRMNDVLDVLHEAAREHKASKEVLDRIIGTKADRRFSVKIDYAADLIPEHLRPAGQPNPIAILHELASEGLHSKSEEECVEIFDGCRRVFEYVFGRLRLQIDEAKEFAKSLGDLAKGKQSPSQ